MVGTQTDFTCQMELYGNQACYQTAKSYSNNKYECNAITTIH